MLNLPLSLLSDDLLACVVAHVEKLPRRNEQLYNLSLADRAFTRFCQEYIFRTFQLGYSKKRSRMSKKLEKMRNILNDKPTFANRVRMVELDIPDKQNAWLLNDPILISIFQLLAKSPMPPHELHFVGPAIIEDPISVVGRLVQSFFSQTLTILHLTNCRNVPLPLFFVCPRLREVLLAHVGVSGESYYNHPDKHCSSRESPALEILNYRNSHSLIEQVITPPPRFQTVVLWSKLRILTLSPFEREEMACLQPILDAACNTVEELYLTNLQVHCTQLPLAGLVNLSDLSCLRVFALHAFIRCDPQGSGVLRDINIVLGTIPASNEITNLSFDFIIFGEQPFRGCLDQDWVGLGTEIIRISAKKPLELDLQTTVDTGKFESPGQDKLYVQIKGRMASLSDYPKICTHFWNPTCWAHGLGPFPRGQVRSKCKR